MTLDGAEFEINVIEPLREEINPLPRHRRSRRVLTDRGTEHCGKPQNHAYQLYLAVEDIDYSRTKTNHPQTNGICERFHKTLQDEYYSLLFRKKLYRSLEELQVDLDAWLESYNRERPHLRLVLLREDPLETFLTSSTWR